MQQQTEMEQYVVAIYKVLGLEPEVECELGSPASHSGTDPKKGC